MRKDIWIFFLIALREYLIRKQQEQQKRSHASHRREGKTKGIGPRGVMMLEFCLWEWT